MKSYRPKHKITVYTYSSKYTKTLDMSNDVISIHVTKGYEKAAGSWQIVTTWHKQADYRKRWDEILVPNDMVLIELDAGGGDGLVPVMRGLVDRVSMTVSTGGEGQINRNIKICGSDMGKILIKHDIGWDITVLHGDLSLQGAGIAQRTVRTDAMTIQGTPGYITGGIFEKYMKGGTKFDLDPAIMQWIKMEETTDDDWVLYDEQIFSLTGSVWHAMMRYANTPWNVLYTETDTDGMFRIYLENRPWDKYGNMSPEVTTHTVTDEDIVNMDVGIGDDDRVNYLFYQVKLLTAQSDQNAIPYFMCATDGENTLIFEDSEEIQRNGLCTQVPETNFVPLTARTNNYFDNNILVAAAERAKTMWNWYKNNHLMKSGTFTVHGQPRLSVGECLEHKETGERYQIEQYDHSYSVFPMPVFLTTMYVTRGR